LSQHDRPHPRSVNGGDLHGRSFAHDDIGGDIGLLGNVMIHDRGSVNTVELAIRRVSFRLKKAGVDIILTSTLIEIADEIAIIASGKDERENTEQP